MRKDPLEMFMRAKGIINSEDNSSKRQRRDLKPLEFHQFHEFISNDIARTLYHHENGFIEMENIAFKKMERVKRGQSMYDI